MCVTVFVCIIHHTSYIIHQDTYSRVRAIQNTEVNDEKKSWSKRAWCTENPVEKGRLRWKGKRKRIRGKMRMIQSDKSRALQTWMMRKECLMCHVVTIVMCYGRKRQRTTNDNTVGPIIIRVRCRFFSLYFMRRWCFLFVSSQEHASDQ